MDFNTTWQYAAVILLVLYALYRIVAGLRKKNRDKKRGSCCGCSLADTCRDYTDPMRNAGKREVGVKKSGKALPKPPEGKKSCCR